mmetsp:Transcript_54036/g.74096  ORF Transcript_54036/g.74096 Transcript_54036/m.74096 type:complete len:216 (+) Transcript_54036:552-1199(+)
MGHEDISVLLLESVSNKHVVLRLFNNRLVKSLSFTESDSLLNTGSSPLRGTPVECKATLNQVVHSSAGLLNWSFVVRSMAEDNINVIKLQALQRVLETFNDMLSLEHAVVGTRTTVHDLSRDNKIFSSEFKFLEGTTHDSLGNTITINFSSVEEVNASIEHCFDAVSGNDVAFLFVGVEPVTETEHGNLKTTVSEVSVDHLGFVFFNHLFDLYLL